MCPVRVSDSLRKKIHILKSHQAWGEEIYEITESRRRAEEQEESTH